jgi:hypothetical protein
MSNATMMSDNNFLFKDTPTSVLNKIEVLKILLKYEINSLDCSSTEYFWIIALGIVTNRIFFIIGGGTFEGASIKFNFGEFDIDTV